MDKNLTKGIILVKDKNLCIYLRALGIKPISKFDDITYIYKYNETALEAIEEFSENHNEYQAEDYI